MVHEVIDAIRDAETQAEHILEEAKKQARAIATRGQADARAQKAEIEDAARREANEIIANTEAYANKRSRLLLEESVQKCEKLKEDARSNMQLAVARIMGSV